VALTAAAGSVATVPDGRGAAVQGVQDAWLSRRSRGGSTPSRHRWIHHNLLRTHIRHAYPNAQPARRPRENLRWQTPLINILFTNMTARPITESFFAMCMHVVQLNEEEIAIKALQNWTQRHIAVRNDIAHADWTSDGLYMKPRTTPPDGNQNTDVAWQTRKGGSTTWHLGHHSTHKRPGTSEGRCFHIRASM
jgi:hypothetical protein